MVADHHKRSTLRVLGVDALVVMAVITFGMTADTLGAEYAIADPNDPGMTNVSPNGHVDSPQSASISGAKPCIVDPGTLGTATIESGDVGVPMQHASESGPDWVGSDGWQAIGTSRSNPWGGKFNPQNTKTGPRCGPTKAGHF